MKYNRKPFFILLGITLAFVLAAVLSFVLPLVLPKPVCPVELVGDDIHMHYVGYGQYGLSGELKNTSDKTVTIPNNNGMSLSFKDSSDKFDNGWHEDYSDIVLAPNATYDFEDCVWVLNGDTEITVLKITIDGTTYYLRGSDSLPIVLGLMFAIVAIIFLCLAITQNQKQKQKVLQNGAVENLSAQTGEKSYIIAGNFVDKRESKKAVARNVGMAVGAVFSTLLTGRGVYSVSSGTAAVNYVLSEHQLFIVNNDGTGLTPLTRNDMQVAGIEIKKNKVFVKSLDGNLTVTLFHNKKLPITVEQIAQYLNNVFLAPLPKSQPVTETAATVATNGATADPFDELKPVEDNKEISVGSEQPETGEVATEQTESNNDGDKPDEKDI